MNGKTAKLLRKVAKERGNRSPRFIRSLKRKWYALNRHERAEKRKEYQQEIQQPLGND